MILADVNWRLLTSVYLADPTRGYVLVSLVDKKGSSYLQPGARMLVRDDGFHWGSVSAGCLEERLSEVAVECLKAGSNRTLSIDTRPHYGCFGEIKLLFEVLSDQPVAEAFFRRIADCLERREKLCLVTPHTERTSGLVTVVGEKGQGLKEHILPAPRLHIFGGWPDGIALSKFAGMMDWQVVVHDASDPRFDVEEVVGSIEPDPWTAVMIMAHNLARDCVCLRSVLAKNYRYVGVIGSHKRRDALIEELLCLEGVPDLEALDSFHCPAGLNLGGEGTESIALSVLAEIQAVLNGGNGDALSSLSQPIHRSNPATS